MIFTVLQAAAVRQGRMSGLLVPRSDAARPGQVRALRRRVQIGQRERAPARRGRPVDVLFWIDLHLDDRVYIDRVTVRPSAGEGPLPVLLTILAVRDLELAALTLDDARVCGYRTLGGLRDSWLAQHPRTVDVRLVRFALGDLRDRPRFLTSTRQMRWAPGKRGGQPRGDFTTNPMLAIDDAEVLTAAQYGALAAMNGQRHAGRQAAQSQVLAQLTAAQRMEAIERAGEQMRTDARRGR